MEEPRLVDCLVSHNGLTGPAQHHGIEIALDYGAADSWTTRMKILLDTLSTFFIHFQDMIMTDGTTDIW